MLAVVFIVIIDGVGAATVVFVAIIVMKEDDDDEWEEPIWRDITSVMTPDSDNMDEGNAKDGMSAHGTASAGVSIGDQHGCKGWRVCNKRSPIVMMWAVKAVMILIMMATINGVVVVVAAVEGRMQRLIMGMVVVVVFVAIEEGRMRRFVSRLWK